MPHKRQAPYEQLKCLECGLGHPEVEFTVRNMTPDDLPYYYPRCAACNKTKISGWGKEQHKRARRDIVQGLLRGARVRAREQNLPYTLTREDVIVPNFCPVLGIELTRGDGNHHAGSPTLDKIRPELGYVPGNVQVISFRANLLKSNATVAELEQVLAYMKQVGAN